ncbi:MAG: alpha/beta hydrolase [Janthinobacterium lividum]
MNLDQDVIDYLALVERAQRPPLHQLAVPAARAAYAFGCEIHGWPRDPRVRVTDVDAATAAGPLRLRVYRSGEDAPSGAPGLVFFHGGGWVVGSLDTHDPVCRELALASGCCVIAVDYRLAPENRSPAAADDALAAYRWIVEHADELGLDAARLGVAGDSAGGFLATVVALAMRDDPAAVRPKLQLLFYPVTDLTAESGGYDRVASGVPFTAVTMRWFRDHYVAHPAHGDDARLSPLNVPDLTGSPDTLIVTSGADPLCEEGAQYAHRLQAAGVRVDHLHLADQIHGFLTLGLRIRAARTVLDRAGEFARQKINPRH